MTSNSTTTTSTWADIDHVELLVCPVCLQTFTDPVLLGECGHTFCRHCIEAVRAPLRCPTCRRPFLERHILPNYALRALFRDAGPALQRAGTGGSVCSTDSMVRSATSFRVEEDRLADAGVPAGLARLIREEDGCIALRIFLLDNSGSTASVDGQVLRDDGCAMRQCTRWEEVCHTAIEQAEWNALLGTPCEFILLNPPARSPIIQEGLDLTCVNPEKGDVKSQVQALKSMLESTGPTGITPMSDRLRKIYRRISPQALDLGRNKQRVVLILVTDGLPTSTISATSTPQDQKEFVNELRRLSYDLPMNLVVRLCTNDGCVADFYNAVDEELELDLEVIDDIQSEAREIRRAGNRFFVYSPLIHRMREGGTLLKLFDILDERPFVPMEIDVFCQLLLRQRTSDAPLPSEAHEFCAAVRKRLPNLPLVYDPVRYGKYPPLDIYEVERLVLPPFDLCKVLYWLCKQAWKRCRKRRQHPQPTSEDKELAAFRGDVMAPVVGVVVGRPGADEHSVLAESRRDVSAAIVGTLVGRPDACEQRALQKPCEETNPDASMQASQSYAIAPDIDLELPVVENSAIPADSFWDGMSVAPETHHAPCKGLSL